MSRIDPYDPSSHFSFHEDLGIYDFNQESKFIESLKNLTYKRVVPYNNQLLDEISFDNYQTELLWWVIYIYNDLIDPFVINKTQLYIPALTDIENLLVNHIQEKNS